MALPGILPSASIAHHNRATYVFCFAFLCFAATADHSSCSWRTEERVPVGITMGIPLGGNRLRLVFGLVDSPGLYGADIWESEFFASAFSLCDENLVLVYGTSTAAYREDIWESEYFPSESFSFGKAVPLLSKLKISYSSYGFYNWEYEFFRSAFPSCKEELVASPGSRTAWHRENIWEASMALPGILSSAPIAQRNVTSDYIIDLTGFWESGCMASENSSCTEEHLFGHGVYVRVGTASKLVDRVNINETVFNIKPWFMSIIGILGPLLLEFLAGVKAKYHHRKSLKPFLRPASPRFPVNNDLRVKLSWAVCLQILREIASGAIYQYQHKMYQRGGYGTSVHTRNRDQQSFSSSTVRAFSLKELYQATNGFKGQLGKGSFGLVYNGTMSCPQPHGIAVKKLTNEVQSIGQIRHRNLVRMIDYCKPGKQRMLIFEFMPGGSLCSFLFKPEKRLPWRQHAAAAIRIAQGPIAKEALATTSTGSHVMHAPRYLRLVYGSHPDFSRDEHGIKELKTKTSSTWVAATAAPHHATGSADLFSGVVIEHDAQFVHASDSVPRKVIARGAVITDTVVLPDVWFVPGLKENLVSVSQLAELDHTIGFGRGECCIRSTRDDKIVGKGRLRKGGHYELEFLKVPLAM